MEGDNVTPILTTVQALLQDSFVHLFCAYAYSTALYFRVVPRTRSTVVGDNTYGALHIPYPSSVGTIPHIPPRPPPPIIYLVYRRCGLPRSSVADMKNSVADRSNAQVSCAGQFIANHMEAFVAGPAAGGGRWLHVDMASPAYQGERLVLSQAACS